MDRHCRSGLPESRQGGKTTFQVVSILIGWVASFYGFLDSLGSFRIGFMSMRGVPSRAFIGPTRSRAPDTFLTFTRWSPIGLGLLGALVAKTPVRGCPASCRGYTVRTSRLAMWNQVITRMLSFTLMPLRPALNASNISNQASGAPSLPCFGALSSDFKVERTMPICLTRNRAGGEERLAFKGNP